MMEEFFDKLGLHKTDDIEKELENRFGPENAEKITAEWDRLSDEADRSDKPGSQDGLYSFLNSNFELSMAVSCYTDADIIKTFSQWIKEHAEYFGKNVLDTGCGTGILSCCLAGMLPDGCITAVDRSENCIRIAEQIKEKTGTDNIAFINAEAESLSGTFDTVLSSRTFHENIGIRYTGNMFLRFSEQVKIYEDIYKPYCRELKRLVSDGGYLICLERVRRDTEFLSILKNLNLSGLSVIPESITELLCRESDFSEKSVFQCFIMKNNNKPMPESELFEIWKEAAFSRSSSEDDFTRAQTDWFTEQNSAGLIEGYETFDGSGTQLAAGRLHKMKDDDSHFMMYQANVRNAGVQVLPFEALQEAREIFSERKLIDRAMGFTVKEAEIC